MYDGIRTENVQSCLEAPTEPRTCRTHQHFHAVSSSMIHNAVYTNMHNMTNIYNMCNMQYMTYM